ncbi:MAG TPA: PQQ-binding-like beta-propeller repeat protein [Mucilaginibacter sp.]|jgi:quinoprotein glucose dehydrogenase
MKFRSLKIFSHRIGVICIIALVISFCLGCNIFLNNKSASSDKQLQTGQHKSWKQYGGSADQSKFVEFKQITKKNVNQLQVAWSCSTGDNVQYLFNPIIVGNVMYLLAKNHSLVALDATNGKEIWIHAHLEGITWKGVNYWESKDKTDRRIIIELNNTLQEIDANTGKSITDFGNNGVVDLKEGLDRDPSLFNRIQPTTPGVVYQNLIMLGSSPGENLFSGPGHVRAYDIVTGKMAWIFHTIPLPGEPGYETWPKDAYKYIGGTNTWGEISLDEKRGIVYFPTGSPTYDYYGADRIGDNLYSDCLIAIDARTGKRLWHFQTVHHDLWDYDLCAAPQLITVNHDGKKIDAVAQASKTGFLYVFNRVTGEPLWPIVEKPVPQSDIPGEKSSPTQPFPTIVPPFGRQGMTADDVSPYLMTADEQESWKKRIASAGTGMFQPLSLARETFSLPGAVGGANFGTTAANPAKGLVYVMNQDYPSIYKITKYVDPKLLNESDQIETAKVIYAQNCQGCHGANKLGGIGPAIAQVGTKLNIGNFKTLLANGKGQMPGFPHISDAEMADIYLFLGGSIAKKQRQPAAENSAMPDGPVVASGGAPGTPPYGRRSEGMRDYPQGVAAPADRYITDNGLAYPFLVKPPWSYIVAYDLNKGTIKWKAPLGQDRGVEKEGGKNTGVPNGAQRKGMIVTSTGVLFSTAKDDKLYAFDADNGKVLWSVDLPGGTEGLPAMYECNGRQYLVISVTAMSVVGRNRSPMPKSKESYIVYALPVK